MHRDRHPVTDGHQIRVLTFLFEATPQLTNDPALRRFYGKETALRLYDETLTLLRQSTLSFSKVMAMPMPIFFPSQPDVCGPYVEFRRLRPALYTT